MSRKTEEPALQGRPFVTSLITYRVCHDLFLIVGRVLGCKSSLPRGAQGMAYPYRLGPNYPLV